jgi:single-strand DNA-binding protein
MALNRYEVIGNVGKDPEIVTTSGGKTIAKLSIATSEYAGKDADGKAKYESEWHSVKVFGPSADYVKNNIKKGDTVFASGRKKEESWDKKDGSGKGYATILQIGQTGRIERTSKKESAAGASSAASTTAAAAAAPAPDPDDEIPF